MPTSDPPTEDEPLLDRLVVRCLHALERGDANELSRVEAEHPELVAAVHERLEWLKQQGLLASNPRDDAPESFGHYDVHEELGRGGMGAVYRAEQTEPLRRDVALKVLKLGMDSRDIVARFETERQTLARLSHDNIARVYDAGITPSGRSFFAMELVDGRSITRYCDDRQCGLDERLRLFATVCDAVQHAHHNGIIHRDLKPSNILISSRNGEPVPKIIDFGIAKSIRGDSSLRTEHGQLLGTPEYMSPEQAGGGDVDTRTDVFSLGVLLYELLTGVLPFDSKHLRQAGFAELRRILTDETPPAPSTRLIALGAEARAIAARHGTEIARLRRWLRGDLDRITMTAMAKDREERYASPAELAGDVRRFLAFEPIVAAPPGFGYRFRKFARRHRVLVAAGALLAAALLVGAVGTGWGLWRANRNLALARSAVDSLLTHVANTSFDDVPRTFELRRALLSDALAFERTFLRENPGDPQARFSAAKVATDLAKLLRKLEHYPEAEARFAEAERLLDALVRESDLPEARWLRANLRANRIEMHALAKRFEPGHADFTAALAELEALERAHLGEPRYPRALAFSYGNYALLLDNTGRDSADASDKHIEYRARVAELEPNSWLDGVKLAVAFENRAVSHMRAEEWDPAAALLQSAIDRLQAASLEQPDDDYTRKVLASALISLAEVRRVTGALERSAELSQRALSMLDRLIEEYPERPDYKFRYALAAHSLGCTAVLSGPEALAMLDRAAEGLQEALQRNPENAVYANTLESVRGLRQYIRNQRR